MSDPRFKKILQAELDLIGEPFEIKELEEDELLLSADVKYTVLSNALKKYFEEGSNTARSLLFSKLKSTISESLRMHTNGPPYIKYASFLKDELHHSYPYLSTLFSQFSGSTLEQYILTQRIEVVKHLLLKHGMGLSEIAWKLGYCSVGHLCNQFKKITGSTPTEFKVMAQKNVIPSGILCETCKKSWVGNLPGDCLKHRYMA